jgi:hypothetical protein
MALSLALVLTACGSTAATPGGASAPTTTPTQANSTQANATPANSTQPNAGGLPKPCDLLTKAIATELIGAGAVQLPLSAASNRCEYDDDATGAIISVGVDTYDPAVPLIGETVTGLSADKAMWAPSSSQLDVVKGTTILTIIAASADPSEGSKALAIRAGGMFLASL